MMIKHSSRTAIVTGAGQNIGRACAIKLAKDGFNILVHGGSDLSKCKSVVEEIAVAAPSSMTAFCVADLLTRTGCELLIDNARTAFGSIDAVINTVAIRPEKNFEDLTLDDWHRVLDVNLTAPFVLCQAFVGDMRKRKWGRIVNFAGMNAISGYNQRAHVSASKHGVVGLTKAIAREFAVDGVTANVISPGPISGAYDDPALASHIAEQCSRVPAGRLGKAEEIAATVSYLASDGGAYCNGQTLHINGAAVT